MEVYGINVLFLIGDPAVREVFGFVCFKKFPILLKSDPEKNSLSRSGKKNIIAILILAFHNESPEVYMGIIKTKKKIKNNKKAGYISVVTWALTPYDIIGARLQASSESSILKPFRNSQEHLL